MSLSIAVLTYNGYDLLPDCLASIGNSGDERYVVDNGSDDPVKIAKIAAEYEFGVKRIENNCGNIGGLNKCFEFAKSKCVLFVSDDVRFYQGGIPAMWFSHSLAGQLMPLIRNKDLTTQTRGIHWVWPGFGFSPTDNSKCGTFCSKISIVPSITFVMKKKLWKAIGGFDETLISSHEDVDMGIRLNKAGYVNEMEDTWQVIHLANSTLSKTLTNHSRRFHESRRMVIRKHYNGLNCFMRLSAESIIYGISSLFQWMR